MLTLDKEKIYFLVLFFLGKILLDLNYYFHVTSIFAYQGFSNDFTLSSYFFSIFITLLIGFTFRVKRYSILNLFLSMCLSLLYLPATTLLSFGAISFSFFSLWSFLFIFMIILFNSPIRFTSNKKFSFTILPKKILTILPYILIIFIFMLFAGLFGFNLNFNIFNFFSDELYARRSDFQIQQNTSGFIGNYVIGNVHNVLMPFLIGFSIQYKKILLFILSLLLYIYVFLITSYKMIFFAPILLIGSYFLIFKSESSLKSFPITFLKYVSMLFIFFFIADFFLQYPAFNSLLTRRLFFMPVLISSNYYDFFTVNGFTFFSDIRFFSDLFIFPFSDSLPDTIGRYYFQEGNHANTNFLADSLTKFGVLSAVIYIVFLRILLELMDFLAKDKNIFIIYSIAIIPLFTLLNSALTTTLLSHGLVASIILITLIREN